MPELDTVCIDLDPDDDDGTGVETDADAIVKEIVQIQRRQQQQQQQQQGKEEKGLQREQVVCVRNGGQRFTARISRWHLRTQTTNIDSASASASASNKTLLLSTGTYIVTGGAGGNRVLYRAWHGRVQHVLCLLAGAKEPRSDAVAMMARAATEAKCETGNEVQVQYASVDVAIPDAMRRRLMCEDLCQQQQQQQQSDHL